MTSFLETIRPCVARRVAAMSFSCNLQPNHLDFCAPFHAAVKPAIIAEIKFASPSRGRIYPGSLDVVAIAGEYLTHGASALSILTEPDYFQGNIEFIRTVRAAFPHVPLLLKDFVLSEVQIAQGLAYGANAVLLIVAFLSEKRLKELYDYALTWGVTPLIEVHDADELERALKLNPKIIGINHRNLSTLAIQLDSSESLARRIPAGVYRIAESGIDSKAALDLMAQRGFDGCLIGSHMMQQEHPGLALQAMREGGPYAR